MKPYFLMAQLPLIAITFLLSSENALASCDDQEQEIKVLNSPLSPIKSPYQHALLFRDCKVEGYTEEESIEEAGKLFLQLAEGGNEKAMHNYAQLLYKKKHYETSYEWFSKSTLDASKRNCQKMLQTGLVKQDLYLVVGSTRHQNVTFGSIVDAIYGHKKSDLSHQKTFDGQATTMDLYPAAFSGVSHIRGDATQYDFATHHKIQAVLLEKFPTLTEANTGVLYKMSNPTESMQINENYMGQCIEQIAKAMVPGALMEIEWLPYITLECPHTDFSQCITQNPFQSFFNLNVALQSAFHLGGDTGNLEKMPQDLVPHIVDMSDKVKQYLEYYHAQGAGQSVQELIDLVYYESYVMLKLLNQSPTVLIDYSAQSQNGKSLKKAFSHAVFTPLPERLVGKKIESPTSDGTTHYRRVYNRSLFQTYTLFNFLLTDMGAENNKDYVVNFMQKIGFKDVEITKQTNRHTGRKNVWMIKAIKAKTNVT
tara:strand:+ start:305 stop:1747 length:1443 start_codon:yes stop_codon:yes gene_type:complete